MVAMKFSPDLAFRVSDSLARQGYCIFGANELERLFTETTNGNGSRQYLLEEFAAFCRDLDLFRKLYADAPLVSYRSRALAPPTGPFVDRCGLLLDAPMLDQARRAAAKFEAELIAAASAVLKKVFSASNRR